MISSLFHVHSTFCDGKSTLRESAETAYGAGIQTLIFTGHSTVAFPNSYCMSLQEEEEYICEILSLQKEYAGKMEILPGIEEDGDSDHTRPTFRKFAFRIGSLHQLSINGKLYDIDSTPEEFCALMNAAGGSDALATLYYRRVAEAVKNIRPDVVGHIDLLTKFNEEDCLFSTESPTYREAALSALRAIFPVCSVLEVNTGAISRGRRTTPYPAPFILEAWRKLGGEVAYAPDSHHASNLLCGADLALQCMKDAGYRHRVEYRNGVFHPILLD